MSSQPIDLSYDSDVSPPGSPILYSTKRPRLYGPATGEPFTQPSEITAQSPEPTSPEPATQLDEVTMQSMEPTALFDESQTPLDEPTQLAEPTQQADLGNMSRNEDRERDSLSDSSDEIVPQRNCVHPYTPNDMSFNTLRGCTVALLAEREVFQGLRADEKRYLTWVVSEEPEHPLYDIYRAYSLHCNTYMRDVFPAPPEDEMDPSYRLSMEELKERGDIYTNDQIRSLLDKHVPVEELYCSNEEWSYDEIRAELYGPFLQKHGIYPFIQEHLAHPNDLLPDKWDYIKDLTVGLSRQERRTFNSLVRILWVDFEGYRGQDDEGCKTDDPNLSPERIRFINTRKERIDTYLDKEYQLPYGLDVIHEMYPVVYAHDNDIEDGGNQQRELMSRHLTVLFDVTRRQFKKDMWRYVVAFAREMPREADMTKEQAELHARVGKYQKVVFPYTVEYKRSRYHELKECNFKRARQYRTLDSEVIFDQFEQDEAVCKRLLYGIDAKPKKDWTTEERDAFAAAGEYTQLRYNNHVRDLRLDVGWYAYHKVRGEEDNMSPYRKEVKEQLERDQYVFELFKSCPPDEWTDEQKMIAETIQRYKRKYLLWEQIHFGHK